MPLPLDFLIFIVVFGLTLTLILTNYVLYLRRGQRHLATTALLAFFGGGLVIGVVLGPAMVALGQQYGTAALLGRWGFTVGWAFLLALAAACTALYERSAEGKISVTLNVVATLLLGFAFVAGLIFTAGSLPPFPASIANLALAAILTAALKWVFEKRRPKPKSFSQRLADFVQKEAAEEEVVRPTARGPVQTGMTGSRSSGPRPSVAKRQM